MISSWIRFALALVASAAAAAPAPRFVFPSTGQSAAQQAVLLAIDPVAWPIRGGLGLFMSKPAVRAEPVLVPTRGNPNAPDNIATQHYGTVMFDEGRFRMWYYALHLAPDGKRRVQGPICYAESRDGLTWTKPALGQVEFNGSRENNAVALPGQKIEGVQVIKDPADPDPRRRYKMAYNPGHDEYHYTLRTAVSPDGINWTAGPEGPIHTFLEMGSLYIHDGYYIVNSQIWGRTEGGRAEGRQAYFWLSSDFERWLQEPGPSFALPEPATGSGYFGHYPQMHLGIAGVSLGNVVIGLYGRWHNRGWGENGTTCDLGLVISHDGLRFHEPVRDHVFISHRESPVTPAPGKNYPTILTQSNSIVNYGDETRIYHGRWRNAGIGAGAPVTDYWAECALATLPRDRWGALSLLPEVTEGFVPHQIRASRATSVGTAWSMPIRLPADATTEISLNADAADQIQVEIADERFNPLPEFSGKKGGRSITRDGLDARVEWGGQGLDTLRGKTVRLRLTLSQAGARQPRFYALYVRAPASTRRR